MSRKRLIELIAVGALLGVIGLAGGGFLARQRLNAALLRAAVAGNVQAVRSILDRGADPNARTGARDTALLLAARRGREETVALLLERGADPNAQDRHVSTALWWVAARDGEMPNRSRIATLLLQHGAEAKTPGALNGGMTALSWAASKGDAELARTLIRHGAEVHAHKQRGETPLESARQAAYNRAESVRFIQRLTAGSPADPGSRKQLEYARHKLLEAEATVRILQQHGAEK